MRRFWAAMSFLTVMPLPPVCRHNEKDLVRSVPLFPIIGLLIGLSAAGIASLLDGIFQPLVSCVILVGWLGLTHGGLHLDGLSDTADGFFSHHDRDRVLKIMGDSRVGAFGCLAIGGILAFKVAALASLPSKGRVKAVVLAPLAGRCMMAPMLGFLPPARLDGLGRLLGGHRPLWESLWAATFLMAAAWFTARLAGLITGFSVMTVTATFGFLCKHRIGGTTGDTVGAASEIAEAIALLTLSAQPMVNLWR